METLEILGKEKEEIKKMRERIAEAIKKETSAEEKRVLEKDLRKINNALSLLEFEGLGDIFKEKKTPREVLEKLSYKELLSLIRKAQKIYREEDGKIKNVLRDIIREAKIERDIKNTYEPFLEYLKEKTPREAWDEGYRVLKVHFEEEKKLVSLLHLYGMLVEERKQRYKNFWSMPANLIEKFAKGKRIMKEMAENLKGIIGEVLTSAKKGG